MKRRMSAAVCVVLKRATMREPSARRSCSDVVGFDSSTPAHSPAGAAGAAAPLLVLAPSPPPRVRPEPVKAAYLGVYVVCGMCGCAWCVGGGVGALLDA